MRSEYQLCLRFGVKESQNAFVAPGENRTFVRFVGEGSPARPENHIIELSDTRFKHPQPVDTLVG